MKAYNKELYRKRIILKEFTIQFNSTFSIIYNIRLHLVLKNI